MWTLARASLEGALVVAAIWALSRALALAPATRTLLWWCAAAKFVLALVWMAPIAIPILPAFAESLSPSVAVHGARAADLNAASRSGQVVEPQAGSRSTAPARAARKASLVGPLRGLAEWSSYAALAWTGGLLLLAVVGVRRWSETAVLVRTSVPAGADVEARAQDLAARLALRRVPAVRVSDRIETPLVTGLFRPVVLLPGERFTALSDRQREMALCHELAHVKRADLWLGCVPALAERLFFFHPLAHFVAREYSVAREAACDAAVVDTLDAAPREYGCLLLALGVSRPQAGAAANAAWSFVHMKRRIAMLQELSSSAPRSRAVAVAAVAVAVLALAPLRLVSRPVQAAPAAVETTAMLERAPAPELGDVEAAGESMPQEKRTGAAPVTNFVLLLGDKQRTVSGSDQDLERALRHQRNGEPMLWVRCEGREYVIRDEEVLRQARAAWQDFNEKQLGQLVSGQVSGQIEALEKFGQDSRLVSEAGQLGAQVGASAVEMAMRVLENLNIDEIDLEGLNDLKELKQLKQLKGLKDLEQLKHLEELKELDGLHESMRHLHESLRDVHEQVRHEVDHSMREGLERHRAQLHEATEHLRAIERPMRELAEPLAEMGKHLGEMGREIGEHAQRAMEEMRIVIDRAIAAGLAQPVK